MVARFETVKRRVARSGSLGLSIVKAAIEGGALLLPPSLPLATMAAVPAPQPAVKSTTAPSRDSPCGRWLISCPPEPRSAPGFQVEASLRPTRFRGILRQAGKTCAVGASGWTDADEVGPPICRLSFAAAFATARGRSGPRDVPRISEFFGVVISMYHNEHRPPHFHAMHGGQEAALSLEGVVLRG